MTHNNNQAELIVAQRDLSDNHGAYMGLCNKGVFLTFLPALGLISFYWVALPSPDMKVYA